MMKKIKLILLVLPFLLLNRLYGQSPTYTLTPISTPIGMPVSWTALDTNIFVTADSSISFKPPSSSPNFRTSLNTYSLPALSNSALKHYADSVQKNCSTCSFKKYFGKGIRNTINLKSSAQYYNPHIAGGKLWIMRMTSSTALGLAFYFNKFMIPNKSFLYIYTADRSKVLGPYTSLNTPSDTTKAIHFGTVPMNANDVYIEYFESDSANYSGNISFDNVVHVFDGDGTNFGGSEPCQQDVACSSGWDTQIASVALILIYDSPSDLLGTCSGALVNNTNNDERLYFLTAAHCYGALVNNTGYGLDTWQFLFDYQSPCCGGIDDPGYGDKVIYGSFLVAGDSLTDCPGGEAGPKTSDYLLLLLDSTAVPDISGWGLCFSGWDATDLSGEILRGQTPVHLFAFPILREM